MITCQEEVFAYFKTLSGSKRIELICGIVSMCIPLEVRYLETFIQDYAKKSCGAFREAESKANSRQELEQICKCDLLMEKTSPDHDDVEINGNGDGSAVPGPDAVQKMLLTKYPSRSKLIISLCLLHSTSHQCSSLAYNFISKQLTTEALFNAVYNVYIPKNIPVDTLFNEILLLLTLAIYHPAFTYEERDLMIKQKEDVEKVYLGVQTYYIQAALQQATVGLTAIQQPPPPPPSQASVAVAASTGPPQMGSGQNAYVSQGGPPQPQHLQHNPQHTQPQSQTVHYYSSGPQHQASAGMGSGGGKGPQPPPPPPPQQAPMPHLAAGLHGSAAFPLSAFMPSTVPIANLTYTPQPQTAQASAAAQVANQTNAVIQSMSILRINSPPSITSTSPSPTISPSSAKMAAGPPPMSLPNQQPIAIKLDNLYTSAATGLPPNSLISVPFVSDATGAPPGGSSLAQPIPYMSLPPGQPIIVEDHLPKAVASSVSSNSSISSSASCYNCGSAGHRGTECTSGGDENR